MQTIIVTMILSTVSAQAFFGSGTSEFERRQEAFRRHQEQKSSQAALVYEGRKNQLLAQLISQKLGRPVQVSSRPDGDLSVNGGELVCSNRSVWTLREPYRPYTCLDRRGEFKLHISIENVKAISQRLRASGS